MSDDVEVKTEPLAVVRLGHGGNCSSVGAVVDTLFVGAVLGSAIFAAVAAALAREPIELVGENKPAARPGRAVETTPDDDGHEGDEP